MTDYVFDPAVGIVSVPVRGGGRLPVRRIFCVGKNYADHVREMGGDARTNPPVFFTKPADAVVESGAVIPYPPATHDLHYEGELVVALGEGGRAVASEKAAQALVFGYAAGCDLTRRDLQAAAKRAGAPWDAAKGFDHSAPVGEIAPVEAVGDLAGARLLTVVNGKTRQDAALADMIWLVPEIIMELSRRFELRPGDLIFTGTPAGVGALTPGDEIQVAVGALTPLRFNIAGSE